MKAKKETVYVAVMDYCSACIKMYELELKKGWQCAEVEEWLNDNTDYSDSQCYYMASKEPIEVLNN